jgi:P-type Cu+ transporter
VAELRTGDLIVVRPREMIAADGEVTFGESAADRSKITGESVPAHVAVGDPVVGGTVALTGLLVENAQGGKATIQRLADRLSGALQTRGTAAGHLHQGIPICGSVDTVAS